MKTPAKRKGTPVTCDWKKTPRRGGRTLPLSKTRFFKYIGDYSWKGIGIEKYKPAGDDWAGIIRQTLIGGYNESAKFHLRYFEIEPRGFSSLEWHKHAHVVIGIRGNGLCIAGSKKFKIGFLDAIYIEQGEPHQLRNPSGSPFGFFCIVNAKRDRPKIITTLSKRMPR